MSTKTYNWFKFAESLESIDWQDNNMAVVEIEGKMRTIGKFKDNVFVFAHKCPHAGAVMADGYIDAVGNVVCPLHRFKFSLQNGRNVTGEGYWMKCNPVESREDGWYVGFETSLFSS